LDLLRLDTRDGNRPSECVGNPGEMVGIADDRKRRQGGSIPLEPSLQAEFWSDPCRITLSKQERALVQT
jgi:hypothetical protein